MAGIKPQTAVMGLRRSALPAQLGARFVWESRRVWRRLGWGAAAGVVCGGLALLLMWQIRELTQQRQSLAIRLYAAQSGAAIKPANSDRDGDIAHRLAAFYAYLPPHEAIPDQLKQLVNVAEKSDVVLSQGEYKPQPESNADFLRYRITLPVKADYPDIQTFIIRALQELPTLTLESVTFKRERIETGEVEARIQYVLLVKKPTAKRMEQ